MPSPQTAKSRRTILREMNVAAKLKREAIDAGDKTTTDTMYAVECALAWAVGESCRPTEWLRFVR